jgi:hypothetical protein
MKRNLFLFIETLAHEIFELQCEDDLREPNYARYNCSFNLPLQSPCFGGACGMDGGGGIQFLGKMERQ